MTSGRLIYEVETPDDLTTLESGNFDEVKKRYATYNETCSGIIIYDDNKIFLNWRGIDVLDLKELEWSVKEYNRKLLPENMQLSFKPDRVKIKNRNDVRFKYTGPFIDKVEESNNAYNLRLPSGHLIVVYKQPKSGYYIVGNVYLEDAEIGSLRHSYREAADEFADIVDEFVRVL